MANERIPAKSNVRPARDPSAPWAANGAKRSKNSDHEREVVYCLTIEGLDLVKIGRTTQLKRRMQSLSHLAGHAIHIGYWAEFSADDAKDIERCALLKMRRHFDSEGEWSLADTINGAAAIIAAASFMGVVPSYEAGAPSEVEHQDECADLRINQCAIKHRAKGGLDHNYDANPMSLRRVDTA